ncbi:TPA: hypothetical protein LU109_003580 [Enterobacter hormaechei subsp. xiangfangensis]|nr:hypothetical protein [Enterobacter hormaechei subsp. xiangfangensis]
MQLDYLVMLKEVIAESPTGKRLAADQFAQEGFYPNEHYCFFPSQEAAIAFLSEEALRVIEKLEDRRARLQSFIQQQGGQQWQQ